MKCNFVQAKISILFVFIILIFVKIGLSQHSDHYGAVIKKDAINYASDNYKKIDGLNNTILKFKIVT